MALLRLATDSGGNLTTTAAELAAALFGSGYTAADEATAQLWLDESGDVAGLLGMSAEDAVRIWLPVRRRVQAWAPSAPLDVQSEAALRLAGWMKHTGGDNPAGWLAGADGDTGFRSSMAGAFHKSGAAEVLSLYRVHPVPVAGGAS